MRGLVCLNKTRQELQLLYYSLANFKGCLLVTSFIEALLQHLLHRLLGRLQRVLLPRLAVVAAQDHDLALAAPQRGEVRHLDQSAISVKQRTNHSSPR